MIIDQASANTFTYESQMNDWDRTASVRIKPRRMLGKDAATGIFYFPPEMASESLHSLVGHLGDQAIRQTLVQRLYTHLRTTTQLEQDLVNPAILKIAQRKIGISLPWDLAFDAYRIYTDESYHALRSMDLEHQIELLTGIKPHTTATCHCLTRLEDLISTVPANLHLLSNIFATIICEMLVPAVLSDIANNERLINTVREVISDHLEDEKKHFIYFSKLLEFLWPLLSEQEQQEIGTLLPQFMLAFLEPDYVVIERTLASCSLSATEIKQIIRDSYPQVRSYSKAKARATLECIERIGILDDQHIITAFQICDVIN